MLTDLPPHVLQGSAWLRRTLDSWERRCPALREEFEALRQRPIDGTQIQGLLARRLAALQPTVGVEQALGAALRQTRQSVVAALLTRDAQGEASLAEVCTTMTLLAEVALAAAAQAAAREFAERYGSPSDPAGQTIDLLVVGMGKLGARELNVSSDIDLVLLYRDEGATQGGTRASISNSDFFGHVARRLVQLLDEATDEGFVFRVDLRLRPYGDAGPIAINLSALEDYLVREGREWERFAWLKARCLADTGLADRATRAADEASLAALVEPFVWRRYLDFSVFDALKDLHARIRAESSKRELRRGGIDVKLGRGGIREIEFIAQLFQIVRGGREPELRDRATLPTLALLGKRGLLPADVCQHLSDDYAWLRRVEHALQYREDAQTHILLPAPPTLTEAASLLRVSSQALLDALAQSRERVAQVFDALLAPNPSQGPQSAAALPIPAALEPRLTALKRSHRWRSVSPQTQALVERLIERALQLNTNPAALERLLDLFEAVLGRPSYLLLLERFPAALERIARTVAQSQWASNYLLRHPAVLDELLDGQILESVDYLAWRRELALRLRTLCQPASPNAGRPPDLERQMDFVREAHHGQVFRLLIQDLEGRLSVEHLSDQLSLLADQVLELAIPTVWSQVRQAHTEEPQFAVIAYGRLGSKELGYASDLDLVFLYDDTHPRAGECYALLAQRVMGWLSSRTAAGLLFEVDLRLRPNGNAGLLVSSFDAFARYQREQAWVWEHQALTRARHCAGLPSLAARFENLRREVLARVRDRKLLANAIQTMRQKILDAHPNRSALFDLKHDRGGLIDVEFCVQYLVLGYGAQHPCLLDDAGNIALLQRAAAAGLLPLELATAAGDAYRHYRALQHRLRLDDGAYARVPKATVAPSLATVERLWSEVFRDN